MTEKKTPSKRKTNTQRSEQEIQAGDGSVAIGGSLTDSAIIHRQTIVLADCFWRNLKSPNLMKPSLPAAFATFNAWRPISQTLH